MYQAERKVIRNLMLNICRSSNITSIFVSQSGTKKRFSHEGTLCESATVPAAVIP